MATEQGPFDVYGNTDRLNAATLDTIATRLEARGQHPRFQQMLQEYLQEMQIDDAQHVLDIGCGTGVATRAILARPNFRGRVTGIDLSEHLVGVAAKLAAEEGNGGRVDFRVGDTRSLALPDNHFDAVVAHTLISHVDSPAQALNEMVRVVKPGGLLTIFDGDYASMTFSHRDPEEGKRYDEMLQQGLITQPRVMRQMPLLLKEVGLQLEKSFFYVISEAGKAQFWMPAIQSFSKLLPASGVMTEAEATRWADELLRASEDGTFFGSSNYSTYIMRKPTV